MDSTAILQSHTASRSAGGLPPDLAGRAPRPAMASGFGAQRLESASDIMSAEGRTIADRITLRNVHVELDVDKTLNRIITKVKDRETGELLSQFPAEPVLNNARAIRDLLAKQLDLEV